MKELDQHTVQAQGISSNELMLHAATRAFQWIESNVGLKESFCVICGTGNNGGDGLVIARLLSQKGAEVECVILNFTAKRSVDFSFNLKLLANCEIIEINDVDEFQRIDLTHKVIIDAIFGYGLNRPAEGLVKQVISKINESKKKLVISIDIPSGMFCDLMNGKDDFIVEADDTLTFHSPKFSFFFPQAGNHPGKIKILDIGLDAQYANQLSTQNYFLNAKAVSLFLNKRKTFSNKGTYGHANLIAGSRGKIGAAVLMCRAAGYAGAGLVSATIPRIGRDVLQTTVPTAMCDDRFGEDFLAGDFIVDPKLTYGIGPGLGTDPQTLKFLRSFLKQIKNPVVIDADALNLISQNPELLYDIPVNSILTPHIKEFERLVGNTDHFENLKTFVKERRVIVVLKDARTIIATPEGDCFFSLNGTPGMATGGSGDVLAGLITGLLAQGLRPQDAAKLGVILHGIAGELAAEKYTEYRMTALEILEFVGESFKIIEKVKQRND